MIISGGKSLDLGFPGQALAESTPITASTGYFYSTEGAELGNRYSTYSSLYQAQPWVATLVDKVAASAARLSFVPWMDTPAGRVQDTTTPWATLWAKPCPLMHTFAFWRWTFSMIELFGEAFWVKVRNAEGAVTGFLPMHPSRTQIERDEDGNVTYKFALGAGSAGILERDATDVVPFLRWNPDSMMRGLSRLEPLRSTLENEQEARKSTSNWWKKGARPSLMLSTDGKLSDRAMNRLAAQVDRQHAGSDNAGRSLILEEGMKPVITQLNAEQMQYIESRKLNREEVCAVFDIPPPVVHILDRATFSNITEQMRSMYRDSMSPRLEDVESAIDFYVRGFDFPTVTTPAKFALDDVLRGDFEKRAEAVRSLVESGIYSPAEARDLFDLPDAGPVAQKLYANAALQPLGELPTRVTLNESGAASPGQQDLINSESSTAVAQDNARAERS